MEKYKSSFRVDSHPIPLVEQRSKPRVNCSYPSKISGHTNEMMKFEAQAVLGNMSGGGMYLNLNRRLEIDETVFVVVHLSTSPLKEKTVPVIAANCKVLRVEPKAEGTYGVAVKMEECRFP